MLSLLGMPGIPELLILLLIIGLPLALVIYVLIDIIKSRFEDNATRIILIIVVILLPVIGSLLYMIIRKRLILKD